MPIFITYARKDRQAAEALSRDLERSHNAVWLDNELTGGQEWWDTILGQIRACDLYLFALSPDSLKSRACRLEFDYAHAVGRPLLPVMIRDVAITTAPPTIANTQIVDYRERTVDAGITLISAVASRPPAPPLPDPLPEPPGPPISYMNEYRDLVDAQYLTYQQQNHLLVDLRGYLDEDDDDDREIALVLIRALRRRRDIAESIGREIDHLLAAETDQQGSAQPAQSAQTPPPTTSAQTPRSVQTPPPAASGQTPPPRRSPAQPQPQAPGQQPSPPYQRPPSYQSPPPQSPPYQSPPYQSPPPQSPPQQPPSYRPVYGAQPGPTQERLSTPPNHPQAMTVLVLGVLGFVTCGITGIAAGIMGGRVLREMNAQPDRYSGRSQVNLGRILGWVTVGLGALYLFIAFIAYLGEASY